MNILLADGQPSVRSALRLLLEQEPGLTVSDEAGDSRMLVAAAGKHCPDLLLLDWGLVSSQGEDLISTLRAKCPELLIIALSSQPEARREALDSGADDFVSKGSPPQQVIGAVKRFKQIPKGEPRCRRK